MNNKTIGAAVAALVAVPAIGMGVSATNIGQEGCTPGYWKNHTDNWLEDDAYEVPAYAPHDRFAAVFRVEFADADPTLLEALDGRGGRGIEGARRILARAATAAILNAAHEGLGYPLRRENGATGIFAAVSAVWDSGDRHAILDLASELDELNNLGCPLS